MIVEEVQKEYTLKATDRCDAECSAQAYIKVTGVTGDLFFCSHHYNTIMNSESGAEKMRSFAYETLDETDRLIENRLIGEN